MATCDISDANDKAFLKFIRFAKHYPDATDAFYDTLFGGGHFSGYAMHPKNRGVVIDFTPASQDELAFAKLGSRGALSAVCSGDLATAYNLLRNEWTSLPAAKQSSIAIAAGKTAFLSYGGTAK